MALPAPSTPALLKACRLQNVAASTGLFPTGNGNSCYGATETSGGNDIRAFGESDREAAAEGISSARGFKHRSSNESGNVLREAGIPHQRALSPQRDHRVSHATPEQSFCGTLCIRQTADLHSCECSGLRFIGNQVIAKRINAGRQLMRRSGIEDRRDARLTCETQSVLDNRNRQLELCEKNCGNGNLPLSPTDLFGG